MMKLVVITCGEGAGAHRRIAEAALAGGCRAVQLRDKKMPDDTFDRLAKEIAGSCRSSGALFFVNDRVEAAGRSGADGVHLGVEDTPVPDARIALGPSAIIGFSPEDEEQAREAAGAGADYLGVGPVFGSASKVDAGKAIGTGRLEEYCRLDVAPVIAVGGINESNVKGALAAGARGVAVISAVARAGDTRAAVERLMKLVNEHGAENG